jgi:transcriptional regulator with XRE-family HTH domain
VEPGKRLKAVRELAGLTRDEMATQIGIGYTRYCNVEQLNARMTVEDLELVIAQFPEFETWLTREVKVELKALLKSRAAMVRAIAERVKAGLAPEPALKEILKR